jgi:hypothetical protein
MIGLDGSLLASGDHDVTTWFYGQSPIETEAARDVHAKHELVHS